MTVLDRGPAAVVARPLAGRRAGILRFVRFGFVGMTGIVVNEMALLVFTEAFHIHYLASVVLATQCSTVWNFYLVEKWAFRGADPTMAPWQRFAVFAVMNNAALLLRIPLIAFGTGVLGVNYLLMNLLSLVIVMVSRFLIADGLIWRGQASHAGLVVPVLDAAAIPIDDEQPAAAPVQQPTAVAPRRGTWAVPLILGSIVAIGLFFRVWELNRFGFNTDEAVYAGQGASIAGDHTLQPYFPIFRAHPLLFQTIVSVLYRFTVTDVGARLLAVAFGVGTVLLMYLAGREIWSRRVGLLAALIMAVMPYHAIVSRQVLLDGPMTFFTTLALYLLARFARTEKPAWLAAASGALALSFLSKETTIIMVGAAYAFIALAPRLTVKLKHVVLAVIVFFVCISPYPLSLKFAGKGSTGNQFLAWQLFRRPNHTFAFYGEHVPVAIGWTVLAVAVVGLIVAWRRHDWRVTLLLSWITVPLVFFSLWPVKGFQYLLPIAAPIAILAGVGIIAIADRLRDQMSRNLAVVLVATAVVVPPAITTWQRITPSGSGTFLAGTGGVPGGREAGDWVDVHVPKDARMLALGPSMANIIQFYGHRKAYGLSVSPNPLHRNPVYEPVTNPDRLIRTNEIQYLIWDSYSASRSKHFSDQLLRYVDRYNGRAVYNATVTARSPGGNDVEKPVITIYEVRP